MWKRKTRNKTRQANQKNQAKKNSRKKRNKKERSYQQLLPLNRKIVNYLKFPITRTRLELDTSVYENWHWKQIFLSEAKWSCAALFREGVIEKNVGTQRSLILTPSFGHPMSVSRQSSASVITSSFSWKKAHVMERGLIKSGQVNLTRGLQRSHHVNFQSSDMSQSLFHFDSSQIDYRKQARIHIVDDYALGALLGEGNVRNTNFFFQCLSFWSSGKEVICENNRYNKSEKSQTVFFLSFHLVSIFLFILFFAFFTFFCLF